LTHRHQSRIYQLNIIRSESADCGGLDGHHFRIGIKKKETLVAHGKSIEVYYPGILNDRSLHKFNV
jgi:hypothetical protein